jgi:predicted branched-subunit amino acid permease
MSVPNDRITLTLDGCRQGARMTLPLLPSIIVFAAAFGSLAAQRGMTWDQALAMSGIVFAGASQMVSIEVWREVWSLPALLEVMAVTAFVNARMILMSASLQPWLKHASGPRQALMLFLLTDANWLLGTRYRSEGGRDLGIYLGSGLILWVVWVAATLPGYLAGALVPEPRRFGLDLLMPIFFSAMLVPLWKGLRPALPWAVAGCVALTAHALAPGYVFIMAGALAGALTGAFLGDD